MRVAHREKPIDGGAKMPRYWIFFDTETFPVKVDEVFDRHELQMGWAVYHDRHTNEQEWFYFLDIESFWEFVEAHLPNSHETLNLMAHNAAFDLRVLKWYEELITKRQWERGKIVILPDGSPLPFVVALKRGNDRIMLRDLANYYGLQPLAHIGTSVGLDKKDDIVNYKTDPDRWFGAMPGSDDWGILRDYCRRDTQIVLRAMHVLMEFLTEHELGNLSISAASQSKTAFRKFMPRESDGGGAIYYHTEESRLALERESYMGGRVEIFGQRGFVNGPIREFDFNSMYPSVQINNLYPVKAVRDGMGYMRGTKNCTRILTLAKVQDLINRNFCIVAKVSVNIPFGSRTHIPFKFEGKLLFPTGEFTTTLTTPELLHAFNVGVIVAVHEFSLYHARRDLFNNYVQFFYGQRSIYKTQGNRAFEQMCKLFMNSLYGKFGQFSHEWEESNMPPGVVPDGTVMRIGNHTYRSFAGVTEVRSERKVEPSNSFAAIAAHVTAYGRTILREAIDAVGDSVVYCDTDSLHVHGEDYQKLVDGGFIDNFRLGALKQEDHKGDNAPSDYGNYRAPKDYDLEGKETKLKGIPKGSQEISPGIWLTEQMQGLSGAFRAGNLDVVLQRRLIKRRHAGYTKGYVYNDQRIVPWHFSGGFKESDDDFYVSRRLSGM